MAPYISEETRPQLLPRQQEYATHPESKDVFKKPSVPAGKYRKIRNSRSSLAIKSAWDQLEVHETVKNKYLINKNKIKKISHAG